MSISFGISGSALQNPVGDGSCNANVIGWHADANFTEITITVSMFTQYVFPAEPSRGHCWYMNVKIYFVSQSTHLILLGTRKWGTIALQPSSQLHHTRRRHPYLEGAVNHASWPTQTLRSSSVTGERESFHCYLAVLNHLELPKAPAAARCAVLVS
jgi:hypothetical protein